jgi:hypothetical protein
LAIAIFNDRRFGYHYLVNGSMEAAAYHQASSIENGEDGSHPIYGIRSGSVSIGFGFLTTSIIIHRWIYDDAVGSAFAVNNLGVSYEQDCRCIFMVSGIAAALHHANGG